MRTLLLLVAMFIAAPAFAQRPCRHDRYDRYQRSYRFDNHPSRYNYRIPEYRNPYYQNPYKYHPSYRPQYQFEIRGQRGNSFYFRW